MTRITEPEPPRSTTGRVEDGKYFGLVSRCGFPAPARISLKGDFSKAEARDWNMRRIDKRMRKICSVPVKEVHLSDE